MLHLQSKVSQIVIGILGSVLLGWITLHYLPIQSMGLLIIACVIGVIGLVVFAQYRQFFWKGLNLQHFLLSLMIASSFIGSAFLTISAGPITIFPYRIFLVILSIVLLLKWMTKQIDLKGQFHIPLVYLFLIGWIIYGILALSWSVELGEGIKEVIFLITGIMVIFIVTFIFKKEEDFLEFYVIWVVMGLLLMAIGFANHFLQIHLPISRIYNGPSYQQTVPTSVFTNENDFASFLGITVFFFISLLKNGKRLIYQMIGGVGTLGSIFLILITNSRANYIALFLGCLFWFVVLLSNREKLKLIWLGFMVLPAILYLQLDKVEAAWGFFKVQIDSLLAVEEHHSSSVDIRENLLKNVKVFIENTFGLGVGPGNVEHYMKIHPPYETFHNYNVHNWWAEILVHYGFFVFIGYILMIVFLFFSLFRIWKTQVNPNQILISEALMCSLIAFIFASISPNSFSALNYNWLLIAFVVAYTNFHYKETLRSRRIT